MQNEVNEGKFSLKNIVTKFSFPYLKYLFRATLSRKVLKAS